MESDSQLAWTHSSVRCRAKKCAIKASDLRHCGENYGKVILKGCGFSTVWLQNFTGQQNWSIFACFKRKQILTYWLNCLKKEGWLHLSLSGTKSFIVSVWPLESIARLVMLSPISFFQLDCIYLSESNNTCRMSVSGWFHLHRAWFFRSHSTSALTDFLYKW